MLLVASDVDGCLLDEDDYSFHAAHDALDELRRRDVPLVLASSKSRAEMELLVRELGLATPFVVENGAAVVFPTGETLCWGIPRRRLVAALAEMAAETGFALRGFSSLSVDDVRRLTGLERAAARRAMQREYDEPFLVPEGSDADARLERAAWVRGLRVSRGGRFHHLSGDADKSRGLKAVLLRYADAGLRPTVVALGDAANDRSLLAEADRPVVVPRPGRSVDPLLARALPGAECAPWPGPRGWNVAVLAVLAGQRLPRVSELLQGRP